MSGRRSPVLVARLVGARGEPAGWLSVFGTGHGTVHVVVPRAPMAGDTAGTFSADLDAAAMAVVSEAAGRDAGAGGNDKDPTVIVLPAGDELEARGPHRSGASGPGDQSPVERLAPVVMSAVGGAMREPLAAIRCGIALLASTSAPGRLRVELRLEHLGTKPLAVRVDPARLRIQVRQRDGSVSVLAVPAGELGFRLEDGEFLDGVRRPLHLKAGQTAIAPLQQTLDEGTAEGISAAFGGEIELVDPPADPDLETTGAAASMVAFRVQASAAASGVKPHA